MPGNTTDGDYVTYTSIDDGHANPAFTLFSVVDDNNLAANSGQIRLRTFDASFVQQNVVTNTDYDAGNGTIFSGAGGVFSDDGKYVAISYLVNASNPQQSILRVYNASDLSLVAFTYFAGGSEGPTFFSLKDHGHKRTFLDSYCL